MTKPSEISVQLRSGDARADGRVTIVQYTRRRAAAVGLKGGAACWGLALVALPIPLVHFIAVPALLLLGPPFAYLMYRMHDGARDIGAAALACPVCRAPLALKARPERWPQTETCAACAAAIVIEPVAAPS